MMNEQNKCFTIKKCFPMFKQNLLCFSLCPLSLVLSLDTTLALSSLHPPFRYLSTLMRSPWHFSCPGWKVLPVSAFLHRRDVPFLSTSYCPLAGVSSVCPCLYCSGEPRTGHRAPGVASPVTSLDLLVILLLMQPWMPLAFFATRSHCWLIWSRNKLFWKLRLFQFLKKKNKIR